MANYKKWTDTELKYIEDNEKLLSDEELSAKLSQMTGQNVTTAMIRRQRRKLGISKPRGRRPKNRVVPDNTVESNQSELV
jgi:arginine repressor